VAERSSRVRDAHPRAKTCSDRNVRQNRQSRVSGEQAEFPFTYDDDDGAELEDLGPLGVAIVCGLAHVGNAALCAVILVGAVVLAPVQAWQHFKRKRKEAHRG